MLCKLGQILSPFATYCHAYFLGEELACGRQLVVTRSLWRGFLIDGARQLRCWLGRRLTVSTSVWCSVKSRGSVSESVNTGIFILPAFESWLGVFPEGEMSSMLKRRAPRQAGNRTALPLRLDGWQDRETLHSHSQGSDL